MTTKKSEVFFEVREPKAVSDYCMAHGMPIPTLYSKQQRGGDYYKSSYEVWEQLYCNGGYGPEGWPLAMGCYPC